MASGLPQLKPWIRNLQSTLLSAAWSILPLSYAQHYTSQGKCSISVIRGRGHAEGSDDTKYSSVYSISPNPTSLAIHNHCQRTLVVRTPMLRGGVGQSNKWTLMTKSTLLRNTINYSEKIWRELKFGDLVSSLKLVKFNSLPKVYVHLLSMALRKFQINIKHKKMFNLDVLVRSWQWLTHEAQQHWQAASSYSPPFACGPPTTSEHHISDS